MLKPEIIKKPLQYFLNQGIKILPLIPDEKRPLLPWKGATGLKNFTGNLNTIKQYWQRGYTAFAFIPARRNLLIIDIDIKHGIDGLSNFKQYLYENQIIIPFSVDDPPVYTQTPSGGMHIYFRSYAGKKMKNCTLCQGVEIKYTNLITAPGSRNKKGKYVFFGEFDDLPFFPFGIRAAFYNMQEEKKPFVSFSGDKEKRRFSLSEIYNYTARKHGTPVPGNRDNFCFQFSLYSFHYKYNAVDIENRLSGVISEDFSNQQLKKCILSAGSYKK